MNDMNPRHFDWAVNDRVAVITLNRPEKKNPLTFDSYAELRDTFRKLATMPEVKCVVLRGAGDNFCSGGDVHEIIGPLVTMKREGRHEDLRRFTQMTGDLVKAMRHCPQPILAAVDGVCAGAGAILAMASDLRFGTPRSRVAFLFVRVGLSGADMGACAILPRIIGQGRAAELLYTGRFMDAMEAERVGFFNRLCAPEELLDVSIRVACELSDGPTVAHAVTKKCLHREWDMDLDQAIDFEAEAQAACMETNDFERAYEAFLERRKPEFQGD